MRKNPFGNVWVAGLGLVTFRVLRFDEFFILEAIQVFLKNGHGDLRHRRF